jgi:hypothetical protein
MIPDPNMNKGKLQSINLNGVWGINITGNTFENLDNTLSVAERWDGIVANNSSLKVEAGSSTNPPNYDDPNEFIDLYSVSV